MVVGNVPSYKYSDPVCDLFHECFDVDMSRCGRQGAEEEGVVPVLLYRRLGLLSRDLE